MCAFRTSNPAPIYKQLKESLRQQVSSGKFKSDAAIPDERSLAKGLRVSRTTMRRAIMELTDEGVFTRIRGRGTFITPRAAQKKLSSLAIVAPFGQADVGNSLFYYRILQGIQTATEVDGVSIVFHRVSGQPLTIDQKVDGVIVLGIVDQAVLQQFADCPLPLVLVDSAQPEGSRKFDSVSHTGEAASYDAVSHLLELGHTQIALMNYAPTPASRQRQAAYERALSARGIAVRPELIYTVECKSTAAYAQMRAVLNAGPAPTAIFCTTDEIALGAMSAAKDHGLSIPRDLSVIGYGDLGHFTWPPLSSIRIPIEQQGVKAVEFLRRRLVQPDAPAAEMVFPSEFLPRATCDCPLAHSKERA